MFAANVEAILEYLFFEVFDNFLVIVRVCNGIAISFYAAFA